MLSLILAVALAASGTQETNKEGGTPVSGTLNGVISHDDYPPEALNRNEQGSVTVRIRVDEKGAVADCVIAESSGSAALDAQTCRLVWLRAKYQPARDKNGKAIAGETMAKVNWSIAPDGPAQSESWSYRKTYSFAPGGTPASCRIDFGGLLTNAVKVGGGPPCSPQDLLTEVRNLPQLPRATSTVIVERRFIVGPEPSLALHAGEQLISRQVLRLAVDAAGNLTSCNVTEQQGLPPAHYDACVRAPTTYLPRKAADGGPAGFTALDVFTVYLRP